MTSKSNYTVCLPVSNAAYAQNNAIEPLDTNNKCIHDESVLHRLLSAVEQDFSRGIRSIWTIVHRRTAVLQLI